MKTHKVRLLQLWTTLALIAGLLAFGVSRLGTANLPVSPTPAQKPAQPQPTGSRAILPLALPGATSAALGYVQMQGQGPANQPPQMDRSGKSGGSATTNPSVGVRVKENPAVAATTASLPDLPVPIVPTSVEPLIPLTIAPSLPINSFVSTTDDRLSTFALDVDTGSYTAVRNYIDAGELPPSSIVRPEEFINYFGYDYPIPEDGAFGIYVDAAPSPYTSTTQYVRVGIQGQRVSDTKRKDAVLTFVIDVSGSMGDDKKLSLVKEALRLLINELRPTDQVGIVVFGDNARILLENTTIANKDAILKAIDALQTEGSTNTEAGLRMAYDLANKYLTDGAINRVILCSDGVANVGNTTPDAIRQSIRDYTKKGITLTTVGFGMGDYNDYLMEQLADDGDGNYSYVDTLSAAKRIFVENLTGTLQVIAKDAKVQVDFNPAVVSRYRLIGYENRDVADGDFRNDTVDAGEIGAGHSVTALYEVELTSETAGDALTVQMRYADPKTAGVKEIKQPFKRSDFGQDFAAAKPRLQLAVAVAAFAEQLRGDTSDAGPAALLLTLVQSIAPKLQKDPDVREFAALVAKASTLQKQIVQQPPIQEQPIP